MRKTAFVFPGQGSQAVGMAMEAASNSKAARQILDEADQALGEPLSKLMEEGPEDTLKKTVNAQPALLTASIAALQLFSGQDVRPDYVAGHSLGEYSALVAAGALSFAEAVVTVRRRGEFMEKSSPQGEGTMAAVMGMEREQLETITKETTLAGDTVELANLNAPGQIVISGSTDGVRIASEKAKSAGARRVIPLNVSGPFHSTLMEPAREQLKIVLDDLSFRDGQVPVVTNVGAVPVTKAHELKQALVEQVTAPVLWEDTIRFLLDEGVDTFIEIGSGKVLSGLVKKVQRRGVDVFNVENQKDMEACLASIKEAT